jgi:hypothetical protein
MGAGFDEPIEAVLVAVLTVTYTAFIFGLLEVFRDVIITTKEPVLLPILAFVWTAVVVAVFVKLGMDQDANSQLFGTRTWFSYGWRTGLTVFNVRVDTWWKYSLVVDYQITRALLGSLLANVFRPYLLMRVQAVTHSSTLDAAQNTTVVILSQSAVSAFAFFATVTDMFLYLSQCDISLVALLVTMVSDGLATFAVLHKKGAAATPQDIERVLRTPHTETMPRQGSSGAAVGKRSSSLHGRRLQL